MSTIKYRQAYIQLGEEREQSCPDSFTKSSNLGSYFASEEEVYWAVRRDYNWSNLPGVFKFVRKTGKREFFEGITSSLLHLEPATSFNPVDAWTAELQRRREQAERSQQDKAAAESGGGKKSRKKVDEMRERNLAEQYAKRLAEEVMRIRNSKRTLLDIVSQVKLPPARAILLVQILHMAYKQFEASKEKRLLYEVVWALEGVELPDEPAPRPQDKKLLLVKDGSLVYDNLKDVEELLAKARKVLQRESDLVRVQLVEMSDSLPPLSRFSFGFKLDDWQVRVLTWIDAGKSVVISAPTSSGKTVLSSYVAVIFKSRVAAAEASANASGNASDAKKPSAGAAAARVELNEQGEEVVSDVEGDDDGEEEEEEGEDAAAALRPAAAAAAGDRDGSLLLQENEDFTAELVAEDRRLRGAFVRMRRQLEAAASQKVLFVVPTEPLVWQVAAYFTKLLREVGDRKTPVAIVTDQLVFNPQARFNVMPQIVVGTPLALESALTKPRGLTGRLETRNKGAGDLLPGGFDHFDWVIYDEVHALDGKEGAALQRIMRCMNCKFLALSATIGNAQQLRAWMEQVRGEQLGEDVRCVTVAAEELKGQAAGSTPPETPEKLGGAAAVCVVRIVKTNDPGDVLEASLSADMTAQALKELVCRRWPELEAEEATAAEHTRHPVQLFFRGQDISARADLPLASCGLFSCAPAEAVVYVAARVHCLSHASRFINLQRYVWNAPPGGGVPGKGGGSLATVSPLAAVSSVQELQRGVLQNSSLSFTSADSFRVFEEARRHLPAAALELISPYNFFGASERITLGRVKQYEDLLKAGLQQLSHEYPAETQRLLDAFRVQQSALELDLCDLVLQLKQQDMLPCLPFHLNTFEAIRLFQQVLCGLELRQKMAHATYYMDQEAKVAQQKAAREKIKKSTGGDAKKEEELAKSGEIDSGEIASVDVFAPHPDFTVCKGSPLSDR
eukprot:gene34959-42335_t